MSERRALLPESGNWYKANLHCHSNISDGKYTPEEAAGLYRSHGYDVLAMTDHELMVPHNDLSDGHFLMLNSYEVQVRGDLDLIGNMRRLSHMNFYAKDPAETKMPFFNTPDVLAYSFPIDISRAEFYGPEIEKEYSVEGLNRLIALGKEHGYIVCWNHPTWSMESADIYTHLKGLFAMEIYNTACGRAGYEAYVPYIYDEMLRSGQRLACVAADDMHSSVHLYGGFTMINAPSLEYGQIINAMEKGDMYASRGPVIRGFWVEDGMYHVECSPVRKIRISNSGRRPDRKSCVYAENGLLTSAVFPVSDQDLFIRLTVTDECGRAANTRAYFREEITDEPASVPDLLHRTIG